MLLSLSAGSGFMRMTLGCMSCGIAWQWLRWLWQIVAIAVQQLISWMHRPTLQLDIRTVCKLLNRSGRHRAGNAQQKFVQFIAKQCLRCRAVNELAHDKPHTVSWECTRSSQVIHEMPAHALNGSIKCGHVESKLLRHTFGPCPLCVSV